MAKASSSIHGTLLAKVGADRVVFPEQEAGFVLARELTRPQLLDQIDLDPESSIVEIIIPEQFDGKTLGELKLRNRYGINVIAVFIQDRFETNLSPDLILQKGKVMVVIGDKQNVNKLSKFVV